MLAEAIREVWMPHPRTDSRDSKHSKRSFARTDKGVSLCFQKSESSGLVFSEAYDKGSNFLCRKRLTGRGVIYFH